MDQKQPKVEGLLSLLKKEFTHHNNEFFVSSLDDKSESKEKKTISLPAAATLKEAQSNVDKLAQETSKISLSSKDFGATKFLR
jgi:hypothetical protein